MSTVVPRESRRVLACGGRDYDDMNRVRDVLDEYFIAEMCEGGARGADGLARYYAYMMQVPLRTFPADWNAPCGEGCTHRPRERNGKRYCPVAGLRRNQQMLDEFRPDLVVAFPGGRGTAHMVSIARAAGVEIVEVQP